VALRGLGRFEEAIVAHTRAATAFHDHGDHVRKARALNNLGTTLATAQRWSEGAKAVEHAVQITAA
jgi:hypothetical protein